jgi:hypothetical protein
LSTYRVEKIGMAVRSGPARDLQQTGETGELILTKTADIVGP